MQLLAVLTIFSVGYSSWILTFDEKNVQIPVEADQVLESSRYLAFEPLKTFQVCRQGLVVDNVMSRKGEIVVSFSMEMSEEIRHSFVEGDTLAFTVLLENEGNFPLFNYVGPENIVWYSVSPTGFSAERDSSVSMTIANQRIASRMTYSESLDVERLYWSFAYPFDFTDIVDFEKEVYEKMDDSFHLSCQVVTENE